MSDVLLHWTGRSTDDEQAFARLSSICNDRILRMTYCPTYVSERFEKQVSMVCFTDIPLNESAVHCSRFGRCGIAFKKPTLIGYGANPVFYTTTKHYERISLIAGLLDRMSDLEKDRDWRDTAETYQFTEDETVALLETLGFLQEYAYQGRADSDAINYNQREWRLTFHVLPFAGGNTPQSPGMSCFYVREGVSYPTMAFDVKDVAYIVVPGAFAARAQAVASALGCAVRIYEEEVYGEVY